MCEKNLASNAVDDTAVDMSKQNIDVLIVFGLQRSGNHSIIDWLCSILTGSVHLNNLQHKLVDFQTEKEARLYFQKLATKHKSSTLILSLEDSANKIEPEDTFLNSFNQKVEFFRSVKSFKVECIVVLRDPYNTLASRLKAQERLTADMSLETYIDNWKDLARSFGKHGLRYIIYNKWRDDEGYRKILCDELGGKYSDRTLSEVARAGGGSSFDGRGRLTMRELHTKFINKSLPSIILTIVRKPKSVINKLLGPRINAMTLNTDLRWKEFEKHPFFREILKDNELQELSKCLCTFEIKRSNP